MQKLSNEKNLLEHQIKNLKDKLSTKELEKQALEEKIESQEEEMAGLQESLEADRAGFVQQRMGLEQQNRSLR